MATIVTSLDNVKNLSELEIEVLGSIFVKKISMIGNSYDEALEKARKYTLEYATTKVNKELGRNYETIIVLDLKQNSTEYEPIPILMSKQDEKGWTAQTITRTIYPLVYTHKDGEKPFSRLKTPAIVNNPNRDIPGFKKDVYVSREIMFKIDGIGMAATREEAELIAQNNARKNLIELIVESPVHIFQFPVKNNIALISEICERKQIGENIEVVLDKVYNVYGANPKKVV